MAGYIGNKSSVTLVDGYSEAEADAEFVTKTGDTMSGNLDVTGTVTSDGLTVDGIALLKTATDDNIRISQQTHASIQSVNDAVNAFTELKLDGSSLLLNSQSGGNVGIGTSSPSADFVVSNGGAAGIELQPEITTDTNRITNYDRAASAYMNFRLDALTHRFLTSGTERMHIDSSGAVTMPSQPAFSATKSSKQSNVATNSQVTVVFDTEVFDQNSDFSGSQFTAPVTGKYQLNLSLYTNELDSAADYYMAVIKTSNREYQNVIDPGVLASDPVYWNQGVSVLADMDANDTAYVFIQQGNGNQQTDVATPSFFSGYLVA